MPLNCTRCERGFINLHQIGSPTYGNTADDMTEEEILQWISEHKDHDVSVCDCCGDGENWYGTAGEHYNNDDPQRESGPYNYNGGSCECH